MSKVSLVEDRTDKSVIVKERLRIFVISFMFAPLVGGAEVQAEKQARYLQALGHDVTVITLRHDKKWKKQEILDGLPIRRVGGIYSPKGFLRLGKYGHLPIDVLMFRELWQLRDQFNVIHVEQFGPISAVAAYIGKLAHKPVIISIPTTGPGKRQDTASLMADTLQLDPAFLQVDAKEAVAGDIAHLGKLAFGGDFLLNYLRKSDAYYQVLSTRSRPYMIEHGFRAENIVNIPNGVDTQIFTVDEKRRPDPTRPERDIMCVARLQYPKGIDILLHAWGRMMHESPEWRQHLKPRLRLAGIGPLQAQLKRIAKELDIEDSVEFMGLRRDVVELLQQSWGFVLPSRWEGMPNALLEAMACGLPCIATRVSGSEDIIKDGQNGLLVEPENPVELAKALRRIIEDTNLARQLAEEGRKTILEEYQISTVVDKSVELYRRLLAKEGKGA